MVHHTIIPLGAIPLRGEDELVYIVYFVHRQIAPADGRWRSVLLVGRGKCGEEEV